MATISDVWGRLFFQGMERAAGMARGGSSAPRLRAFPNEDLLFYLKDHNNTPVVRAADPAARGRCWKMIGSVGGAAVLLIGVLLPASYSLMAGYTIDSLRREGQQLATDQAVLQLRQEELRAPARIQELARQQQFAEPSASKVLYLDGSQHALAMAGK